MIKIYLFMVLMGFTVFMAVKAEQSTIFQLPSTHTVRRATRTITINTLAGRSTIYWTLHSGILLNTRRN